MRVLLTLMLVNLLSPFAFATPDYYENLAALVDGKVYTTIDTKEPLPEVGSVGATNSVVFQYSNGETQIFKCINGNSNICPVTHDQSQIAESIQILSDGMIFYREKSGRQIRFIPVQQSPSVQQTQPATQYRYKYCGCRRNGLFSPPGPWYPHLQFPVGFTKRDIQNYCSKNVFTDSYWFQIDAQCVEQKK